MSREEPITDQAALSEAVVQAFLDGDAATRQHIVDELGARARPKPPPDDDVPELEWS